MSCLAEWQSAVAAAIDSEAATCPCPDRAVEVPGPSIEQGSAVYRNSSRGARARALEDAYPVCRRLLGAPCFGGLAARFIGKCASRGSDLNRFGEGFSVSLGATVEHQPAFDRYPWLGDLVRLEWLCHSIHYRDDDARRTARLVSGRRARGLSRPRVRTSVPRCGRSCGPARSAA